MKDTEFISKTAEQYAEKFNIEKSYLYEVGLIGLQKARKYYTQDMGISPKEYAEMAIEGEIRKFCRGTRNDKGELIYGLDDDRKI